MSASALLGTAQNALMAGATSVYLDNPIQRFQRDLNVG